MVNPIILLHKENGFTKKKKKKEKKKKKILTIAVPVSSRQQAIASMHTCSVT